MLLSTHPGNRKEMVRSISELLEVQAQYMYLPTYAYRIGPVTVNKDGTLTCEDESILATLLPMLIQHGWLEEDQAPDAPAVSESPGSTIDSDDASKPDPAEASGDSEETPESHPETPANTTAIALPLHDWTVSQLTNLLRMFYSKQHLLNRMLESHIYIQESFVKAVSENPPAHPAEFEDRFLNATVAECVRGMNIAGGQIALTLPFSQDPARCEVYSRLLAAILKASKEATRIALKAQDDPENEKYHANSWLMRLGFRGPEHKELRHVLMHHLNGYAAFKSEADMLAHREKFAQRRREMREAVQE